jgi:probable rRNA maturation factor
MSPPRPPTPESDPAAPRAWSASRRHPRLRFTPAKLERCFRVLDAQRGPRPPAGEISLVFLTGAALARLHGDFLGDASPTDVITFPGDPPEGFAGEICLSVDCAAGEAAKRGQPLARELTLYLVHGWLHLAGLDDRDAAGRRAMRRNERRLLAALTRARALPDFRLARARRRFRLPRAEKNHSLRRP